ncbi:MULTISPECIES: hypothetical protein [Brevibacillus]|uniref:hypothetical protein n=1 Tax=Brevibacillus TaxID=55080 RepID=UPI001E476713|nr:MULTISPECIES: hypothetical protein [Brevibacillus]MED1944860.1 hypothetical protein [Brevibacillus formosus]MED1996453.1 hypothetical protein [Brevibacillus formosus]MED2081422.1 hypothetical protein [Brevibacillus formosus]
MILSLFCLYPPDSPQLKQGENNQLAEETGEISEDLRDTDRDGMQKAKHAFKRPPLKHILIGPLWTRFRFLHGVVRSIPQGVALEAERFLLFPPHHYSQNKEVYYPPSSRRSSKERVNWLEEYSKH